MSNPYALGQKRFLATFARGIGRNTTGRVIDANVAHSANRDNALRDAHIEQRAAFKLALSREIANGSTSIGVDEANAILNDAQRIARLQTRDDNLAARHWRWTRGSETTIERDASTRQLRGKSIAGDVRALPRNATDAPGAGVTRSPRPFTALDVKDGLGTVGAGIVAEWASAASRSLDLTRDNARTLAADLISFARCCNRSEFPILVQHFRNASRVFDARLKARTESAIFAALSPNARRDLARVW